MDTHDQAARMPGAGLHRDLALVDACGRPVHAERPEAERLFTISAETTNGSDPLPKATATPS